MKCPECQKILTEDDAYGHDCEVGILAPDGKPYDIDNLGTLKEGDIEIIQYLRPDGLRRKMSTRLTPELYVLSTGLILSCEELGNGRIAIYGRRKEQDEEQEYLLIAKNEAGDDSPNAVLEKVIQHCTKTVPTFE